MEDTLAMITRAPIMFMHALAGKEDMKWNWIMTSNLVVYDKIKEEESVKETKIWLWLQKDTMTANTSVTTKDHSMEDSDYGSIAKEFNRWEGVTARTMQVGESGTNDNTTRKFP